MKSKKFPDPIFSEIQRALEIEALKQPHPIAAFDADGTLWQADLGESFFQYQIRNQLLKSLPPDPWLHYHQMKTINEDPRSAYLWLAQINQGLKLDQVRKWASASVTEMSPLPIFEEQFYLIDWLKSQGVRIFVVTASIKWAVEPGVKFFGIPEKNVIGVATTVENGIITDQQDGFVPYRQGKAEALLQATAGIRPFLCSGNTMGDFELLKCSSQFAMAVRSAQEKTDLFETETSLFQEAHKIGWQSFRFT